MDVGVGNETQQKLQWARPAGYVPHQTNCLQYSPYTFSIFFPTKAWPVTPSKLWAATPGTGHRQICWRIVHTHSSCFLLRCQVNSTNFSQWNVPCTPPPHLKLTPTGVKICALRV